MVGAKLSSSCFTRDARSDSPAVATQTRSPQAVCVVSGASANALFLNSGTRISIDLTGVWGNTRSVGGSADFFDEIHFDAGEFRCFGEPGG